MAFVLQETSEQEKILADHLAEFSADGDTVYITHKGYYEHLPKLCPTNHHIYGLSLL